ncbi:MAG: YraN family protein [Actinomycetota bacterium]
MASHRSTVGDTGEEIAARFLARRGVAIIERNVRVGRDEIDLLSRDRGELVAVEVKTGVGRDSRPWENFDDLKSARIRRAARALSIHRVDLIAVQIHDDGATVRWLPAVG